MFLSSNRAFDRVLRRNGLRLPLTPRTRLVLFSDLHRGAGDWADDFMHNQLLFETALEYYLRRRFTYVELGDGDELVENRGLEAIVRTYGRIFRLLDRFHREGRFIYLYGNHNLQMNSPRWRRKHLARARTVIPGLWEGLEVRESVLLGDKMLFFHGHQAEALSTRLAPLSRLFIRFIWRFLQNVLGFKNPLSVSQNPRQRTRLERKLAAWAVKRKLATVTGHTHRPLFMSLSRQDNESGAEGRPNAFNAGCGVHPRAVTALEVTGRTISLVSWRLIADPGDRGRVRVSRRVPAGCRTSLRRLIASL